MKLKINKLNSIQLKDWRSLYNFARPTHLLRWRTEKRKGRKIIVGAPPCNECQYEPTQLVEGSALLWISPCEATNGYQEKPYASSKGHERLPLACANLFFFNCKKTKTPWTPWDNCKKTKAKKLKTPHYLRQKKKEVDPRSYSVITLYKTICKIQKYILNVSCVVFSESMV